MGSSMACLKQEPASPQQDTPPWAAEWCTHFLGVIGSFVMLAAVSAICFATLVTDRTQLPAALAPYVLPIQLILPEPAERAAYVLALVVLPLFLLATIPWRYGIVSRWSSRKLWVGFLVSCVAFIALLVTGGIGDEFLYWRGSLPFVSPIAFLIAIALFEEARWQLARLPESSRLTAWLARARDGGLVLTVVAFIGLNVILRIFSANDPYVAENHFEAVFWACVQVCAGKTLMVDLPHQYGLYPEFLAPLFHLAGGITVLKFSLIMAMLQTAVFLLWLVALMRLLKSFWLAMLTFLGMFSFLLFLIDTPWIGVLGLNYYDPYFQFGPVRMLFPAIALVAMTGIAEDRFAAHHCRRNLVSGLLGLGVAWNIDAGVPALGAWVLCLCHRALFVDHSENTLLHQRLRAAVIAGSEAMAAAAVSLFLVLLALSIKAGRVPDPATGLQFQRDFYILGFNMIPMQFLHSWLGWAAIMMGAMAYALTPLCPRSQLVIDPGRRSVVFGWTVLCCGLFSYFQGRSHFYVFPAVTPIAFALVALTIDRIFLPTAAQATAGFAWRRASGWVAAGFVLVLFTGSASVWRPNGVFLSSVADRWQRLTVQPPEPTAVTNAVDFLKARIKPGDSPLILSYHAGVYHSETETIPRLRQSLVETFRRDDLNAIVGQVAGADRIFIDNTIQLHPMPGMARETDARLLELLKQRFDQVGESPGGYLREFRRKPIDISAPGDQRK